MKRVTFVILALALLISVSVSAETKVVKGPFVDTIYFDVRMQQEIGLKDTAAGKTDVFMEPISANMMRGLDKADLAKYETYSVPASSYSLLTNPIPNKAPYLHKVEGKDVFNPFAIREVRFALNYLINRKYIVNEILGGAGGPMFTITTPGQPGTIPYELNAAKMGFTADGDEARALDMINDALTTASKLDALSGKLKKGDKFWEYDGQPLTVKFIIRVDDPAVRVKEGEYVSQQLEKAGLKVEKLMYDRSKANKLVYSGNPADYTWTLYTEGWGAGATRAFWAHIVAQFYGPWYGYMPGGATEGNWNYENKDIDDLSAKAYSGDVASSKEYWDSILKAQTIGLKEAVRIMVAYEKSTFVANKSVFTQRMAYGLGDGMNQWSLITAKPKSKTLRVTQYSSKGSLFMSSWDPVGPGGFNDTYSMRIAELLHDLSAFESPVDGMLVANRADVVSYSTKMHRGADGKMVGEYTVPTTAMTYNSQAKKWEKLPAGKTAWTMGKYKLTYGKMHSGAPVSMEDYYYGSAFIEEWRKEDGKGDKWYDAEYDSNVSPLQEPFVGTVYDAKNGTITVYANYNFPADADYAKLSIAPSWSVAATPGIGVSWEVIAALARMVAQGSASGTVWSFSQAKEGTTEVDVLNPKCVADIKAELKKMIAEKYVPNELKGISTSAKTVARYQLAVKFIDKYGHAYISDGPFYLAKYDPKANYAEVKANRDPSYPHTSQKWLNLFKRTILSVENIDIPMLNARGTDIPVKLRVSQATYPEIKGVPATVGTASIMLITDKGDVKFNATRTAAGTFSGVIPASATKGLEPGSYTVVVLLEGQKGVVGTNVAKVIVLR